jgi:hypothetical protein
MQICKLTDGQPTDIGPIPEAIPGVSNPRLGDMLERGWLMHAPSDTPHIKASHWEAQGHACVQVVDAVWSELELAAQAAQAAEDEAARKAAEEAARIASFQPLTPVASLYRITLRKHFGDNAETNHDVTKSSVSAYFEQKRMAGTITAVETADALALTMYFDILAAWNGTGETWTVPWQVVP